MGFIEAQPSNLCPDSTLQRKERELTDITAQWQKLNGQVEAAGKAEAAARKEQTSAFEAKMSLQPTNDQLYHERDEARRALKKLSDQTGSPEWIQAKQVCEQAEAAFSEFYNGENGWKAVSQQWDERKRAFDRAKLTREQLVAKRDAVWAQVVRLKSEVQSLRDQHNTQSYRGDLATSMMRANAAYHETCKQAGDYERKRNLLIAKGLRRGAGTEAYRAAVQCLTEVLCPNLDPNRIEVRMEGASLNVYFYLANCCGAEHGHLVIDQNGDFSYLRYPGGVRGRLNYASTSLKKRGGLPNAVGRAAHAAAVNICSAMSMPRSLQPA